MAPEDQDKTAFITDLGVFCYKSRHWGEPGQMSGNSRHD
jgi:hypothetical protein